MSKTTLLKLFATVIICAAAGPRAEARPEYLKLFAADPRSRPELRSQCAVCHVNPAGAGERNEFGKAFAAAGLRITPDLRRQWPDRFLPEQGAAPPVTLSRGRGRGRRRAQRQAVRHQHAREDGARARAGGARGGRRARAAAGRGAQVYHPVDVRVINLPTGLQLPKGSLWSDFTHRFPLSDLSSASELFGLDSIAVPAFGFSYGLTDRIQIGAYRAPTFVGRPIEIFAGVNLLDERKEDPLTATARVGLEGRDNFQRNFRPVLSSPSRGASRATPRSTSCRRSRSATARSPGRRRRTCRARPRSRSGSARPSTSAPRWRSWPRSGYRLNEAARYLNEGAGIAARSSASASRRRAPRGATPSR